LRKQAEFSCCNRAKVAAFFFDDEGEFLGSGYNRPISKDHICDDTNCKVGLSACNNTIHAEEDAILLMDWYGVNVHTCIVTMQPCRYCTRLLIYIGVKEVIYLDDYRDHEPIAILKKAGIKVTKYDQSR
jgi:dCMP deaminase